VAVVEAGVEGVSEGFFAEGALAVLRFVHGIPVALRYPVPAQGCPGGFVRDARGAPLLPCGIRTVHIAARCAVSRSRPGVPSTDLHSVPAKPRPHGGFRYPMLGCQIL
jgi:hypothetical protein